MPNEMPVPQGGGGGGWGGGGAATATATTAFAAAGPSTLPPHVSMSAPPGSGTTCAEASSAGDASAGRRSLRDASKHRKPYVVSKARDRWTDAEHASFVDALKMYGRSWRKIEGE